MASELKMTPETIQAVSDILSRGKMVEIAERNGKLVVWEITSRKKHEVVIQQG